MILITRVQSLSFLISYWVADMVPWRGSLFSGLAAGEMARELGPMPTPRLDGRSASPSTASLYLSLQVLDILCWQFRQSWLPVARSPCQLSCGRHQLGHSIWSRMTAKIALCGILVWLQEQKNPRPSTHDLKEADWRAVAGGMGVRQAPSGVFRKFVFLKTVVFNQNCMIPL